MVVVQCMNMNMEQCELRKVL